jgi:hypothetical protein
VLKTSLDEHLSSAAQTRFLSAVSAPVNNVPLAGVNIPLAGVAFPRGVERKNCTSSLYDLATARDAKEREATIETHNGTHHSLDSGSHKNAQERTTTSRQCHAHSQAGRNLCVSLQTVAQNVEVTRCSSNQDSR